MRKILLLLVFGILAHSHNIHVDEEREIDSQNIYVTLRKRKGCDIRGFVEEAIKNSTKLENVNFEIEEINELENEIQIVQGFKNDLNKDKDVTEFKSRVNMDNLQKWINISLKKNNFVKRIKNLPEMKTINKNNPRMIFVCPEHNKKIIETCNTIYALWEKKTKFENKKNKMPFFDSYFAPSFKQFFQGIRSLTKKDTFTKQLVKYLQEDENGKKDENPENQVKRFEDLNRKNPKINNSVRLMRKATDLHNFILDYNRQSRKVLTVVGIHKSDKSENEKNNFFPIFGQNLDFDFFDIDDFKDPKQTEKHVNGLYDRFSSFLEIKSVSFDFDQIFYEKMKKYNYTTLAFFYSRKLNSHKKSLEQMKDAINELSKDLLVDPKMNKIFDFSTNFLMVDVFKKINLPLLAHLKLIDFDSLPTFYAIKYCPSLDTLIYKKVKIQHIHNVEIKMALSEAKAYINSQIGENKLAIASYNKVFVDSKSKNQIEENELFLIIKILGEKSTQETRRLIEMGKEMASVQLLCWKSDCRSSRLAKKELSEKNKNEKILVIDLVKCPKDSPILPKQIEYSSHTHKYALKN